MKHHEIEKAVAYNLAEVIEYVPNSVGVKSIINKLTGNVNAVSYDIGASLFMKIIPFDTYIQIIDGKAELIIDGISTFLNNGQAIVIPAHTSYFFRANERFKMISTIIKSRYEPY